MNKLILALIALSLTGCYAQEHFEKSQEIMFLELNKNYKSDHETRMAFIRLESDFRNLKMEFEVAKTKILELESKQKTRSVLKTCQTSL